MDIKDRSNDVSVYERGSPELLVIMVIFVLLQIQNTDKVILAETKDQYHVNWFPKTQETVGKLLNITAHAFHCGIILHSHAIQDNELGRFTCYVPGCFNNRCFRHITLTKVIILLKVLLHMELLLLFLNCIENTVSTKQLWMILVTLQPFEGGDCYRR